MKKLIIAVLVVVFFSNDVSSQTKMQASIGIGSTNKRVKIYIKPSAPVNGVISTLQFNIAISSAIAPVPTLSIVGVPPIGSGWVLVPSFVEGAYRNYPILTASTPSINIGAVETEVMELEFNGGPSGTNSVALVTLAEGGATGNAIFLCTGAASSDDVSPGLYYTRAGTTVVNNPSYTAGQLPSTATIGGVILPVNWLGFDAIKKGSDAVLSWKVANEEFNKNYEVQRSINGSDFVSIATINKTAAGNGIHNYEYTDQNIDNLGSEVVYYRLKQVDESFRSSLSEIRSLKINIGAKGIQMYPNPVKNGFYLNVPFTNTDQAKVGLTIMSGTGQVVQTREISSQQATNYYYDIKNSHLAPGDYYLKIVRNGQVLDIKKFLISKE
jgi:hypothetical protein